MTKSYPDITKRISNGMKTLRSDITDTVQGFSAMAQAATKDGVLDKKTKELIARQSVSPRAVMAASASTRKLWWI